jgi:hypothetical protein
LRTALAAWSEERSKRLPAAVIMEGTVAPVG